MHELLIDTPGDLESLSWDQVLRKRKSLIRELRRQTHLLQARVAILSGSTPNELSDFLEVLLLKQQIEPTFYYSAFNRYFEESVFDTSQIAAFAPQIAYVHITSRNIETFPRVGATESELSTLVRGEISRLVTIWTQLKDRLGCVVILNNFELPGSRPLGNLDCISPAGRARFVNSLNSELACAVRSADGVFLNDANGIAAELGLSQFHDVRRWLAYKIPTTPQANFELAKSVAAIIASIYGRSRKCLVLDLDNTIWGGEIGELGPDGIRLGGDGSAEGEAFRQFQEYCLALRERGVLLAVCSKNSEAIALKGLDHSDSILKKHHFSCFIANWKPKDENIRAIAQTLNIGLDSLVFVDDDPAERDLIAKQLPAVAVPEVGNQVTQFAAILEKNRYFEVATLSAEDLERATQYQTNVGRITEASRFANYEEYLDSLEMNAEIRPFALRYRDRITQLINKTNQFNLTAKRYTRVQIDQISENRDYVTLYGRLSDRLGDNGIVSAIIAKIEGNFLHIDLWIMSCRVLKRDFELAMFDALVNCCQQKGITAIYGYYLPTERNVIVERLFADLGFGRAGQNREGQAVWEMPLEQVKSRRNMRIREVLHD